MRRILFFLTLFTFFLLFFLPVNVFSTKFTKELIDFEKEKIGKAPEDFLEVKGDWIVKDSKDLQHGKVLSIKGKRFQSIIVYKKEIPANFGAEVEFNILAGKVDPTAGFIVGFQNYKKPFYVCRVNSLEHNLIIWRIQGESRTPLRRAKVPFVTSKNWGKLYVEVKGNTFFCKIKQNGFEKAIRLNMSDYTPGKVGFWIKADSITWFDNLKLYQE